MSVGAIVLQYAVQCVLPLVLKEASSYAIKRATRHAVDQLLCNPAAAPQPLDRWPVRMLGPAEVLSHTPGRVRLKVAGLRGNEAHVRALEVRLSTHPGVVLAEASAITGNLLVHYAPAETTLSALQAALTPRSRSARSAAARADWHRSTLSGELRKWA